MGLLFGNTAVIKSIQNVVIDANSGPLGTTKPATITSVDTDNAYVKFTGSETSEPSSIGSAGIELTDNTTVTALYSTGIPQDVITKAQVVEYNPGIIKSIQTGLILLSGATTTQTATISAVNTAKTEIHYNNIKDGDEENKTLRTSLEITDSTTVTCARDSAETGSVTTYFTVVEFV